MKTCSLTHMSMCNNQLPVPATMTIIESIIRTLRVQLHRSVESMVSLSAPAAVQMKNNPHSCKVLLQAVVLVMLYRIIKGLRQLQFWIETSGSVVMTSSPRRQGRQQGAVQTVIKRPQDGMRKEIKLRALSLRSRSNPSSAKGAMDQLQHTTNKKIKDLP